MKITLRTLSIFVGIMIVFCIFLVDTTIPTDESNSTAINKWVRSHASYLPQTYREFCTYPYNYRRQIFVALPPEKKSEFTKMRLIKYLEEHPEVGNDKRSFIQDAIEQIDPAIYSYAEGHILWEPKVYRPSLILEQKARKLFSESEYNELSGFGPKQISYTSFRALQISLTQRLRDIGFISPPVAVAEELDPCDCRNAADCAGHECTCTPFPCSQQVNCGFAHTLLCDKVCFCSGL